MNAAPTLILSAPQGSGKPLHAPALQREHGCTAIVDEWHPSHALTPGALHLTYSHPADVESWGHPANIIIARGWPCARDLRNPFARVPAHAEAGGIALNLSAWLGAMVICLVVFMAQQADLAAMATALPDRRHEQAQADAIESRLRAEDNFRAWLSRQQEECGPNTGYVPQPNGAYICTDKRGRKFGQQLAGVQP